jgi:hypothetical protein
LLGQLVVGAWVKVGAHISYLIVDFKFQNGGPSIFRLCLATTGSESAKVLAEFNPTDLNRGFVIPFSKESAKIVKIWIG